MFKCAACEFELTIDQQSLQDPTICDYCLKRELAQVTQEEIDRCEEAIAYCDELN